MTSTEWLATTRESRAFKAMVDKARAIKMGEAQPDFPGCQVQSTSSIGLRIEVGVSVLALEEFAVTYGMPANSVPGAHTVAINNEEGQVEEVVLVRDAGARRRAVLWSDVEASCAQAAFQQQLHDEQGVQSWKHLSTQLVGGRGPGLRLSNRLKVLTDSQLRQKVTEIQEARKASEKNGAAGATLAALVQEERRGLAALPSHMIAAVTKRAAPGRRAGCARPSAHAGQAAPQRGPAAVAPRPSLSPQPQTARATEPRPITAFSFPAASGAGTPADIGGAVTLQVFGKAGPARSIGEDESSVPDTQDAISEPATPTRNGQFFSLDAVMLGLQQPNKGRTLAGAISYAPPHASALWCRAWERIRLFLGVLDSSMTRPRLFQD